MERRFIKIFAIVIGTVIALLIIAAAFFIKRWKDLRTKGLDSENGARIVNVHRIKSDSFDYFDDVEESLIDRKLVRKFSL